MSLVMKAEAPNGVVGNYWKVSEVTMNLTSKTSMVTVFHYVDEKSYLDGKQPLEVLKYQFDGADYPFTDEALAKKSGVVLAYKKLQDLEQFKGAKYVE